MDIKNGVVQIKAEPFNIKEDLNQQTSTTEDLVETEQHSQMDKEATLYRSEVNIKDFEDYLRIRSKEMKILKCPECTFQCNHSGSFKRHMLKHTSVKLFKCSECRYECYRKDHLKTHILTHASAKLFKCTICSFECGQKRYLKRHMLRHATVKLFKCSECSYECNRKYHLKAHMLSHGENFFSFQDVSEKILEA